MQNSTFASLAEQAKTVRLPTLTTRITRRGRAIPAARGTCHMTRYTTSKHILSHNKNLTKKRQAATHMRVQTRTYVVTLCMLGPVST